MGIFASLQMEHIVVNGESTNDFSYFILSRWFRFMRRNYADSYILKNNMWQQRNDDDEHRVMSHVLTQISHDLVALLTC